MSSVLRPVLRSSSPSGQLLFPASTTYVCQQCRSARLLRRPKRPYTFTQLVTLSDGSAFTLRTTSPQPVYRCTRDTRNAPLWNPSSKELLNIEEDEAGRLSGFRARYGTGFDASKEAAAAAPNTSETTPIEEKGAEGTEQQTPEVVDEFAQDDSNLLDLISSFGQEQSQPGKASMIQRSRRAK